MRRYQALKSLANYNNDYESIILPAYYCMNSPICTYHI